MPLRFFPESALAYAEKWHAEKEETHRDWVALNQAQKKWAGSYEFPGENMNSALRLVFRDADPLEDIGAPEGLCFRDLALRVWLPFLQAL